MPDWFLWAWLVFASQVSGYPLPADHRLPKVAFVTAMPPDAEALTETTTGEITIRKQKRDAAWLACLLAHEETHVLQVWDRVPLPCHEAHEPPAYRVEAACFHLFGYVDEERYSGADGTKILA